MERGELIEWIIIIAIIVAWWPHLFLGFDVGWYHALIYYVSPIVLAVILVRRYRRMQEGFEYSRKIVDAQHQATGANVLGRDAQPAGRQSPYPGVFLPDDIEAEVEAPSAEAEDEMQLPPNIPNVPDIPGIPEPPDEDQAEE
ncbi:MAG: hypothetical protein U9R79_13230 [Armatimonadota bacterium]|nr:hypothetical protein [Armatimonadota bacterium]